MSESTPARWRTYVTDRGFVPIEVLAELIRGWDGTVHVPSVPRRPNRLGEVDEWQDGLRDHIVAACDRLEQRRVRS